MIVPIIAQKEYGNKCSFYNVLNFVESDEPAERET